MLGFAEGLPPWVAITLFPAFVGLLLVVSVEKVVNQKYLSAFALGIFLWFFVDTIKASGALDVAAGFAGGASQVSLVGLFVIGILLFFSTDRHQKVFSPREAVGKYGVTIPLLVAVSVGIHGIGEGASFGGTAALTTSASLLDAFGGISSGLAYVLHKVLEPMMIGACYCVYSSQLAKNTADRLKDLAVLSTVFAIPSLVGGVSGYYLTYDSSYFYALGTGTSVYAAMRLAGPLFSTVQSVSQKETIKIALSLALGLLAIYFAALFHSG